MKLRWFYSKAGHHIKETSMNMPCWQHSIHTDCKQRALCPASIAPDLQFSTATQQVPFHSLQNKYLEGMSQVDAKVQGQLSS